MPACPSCQQPTDAQAILCPHCRKPLKAYGHPGIPLHRATGNVALCETCTYHADDTCTFPQRPFARECTLYVDVNRPVSSAPVYRLHPTQAAIAWIKRHPAWIALAGLLGISVLLALSSR